MEQSATSIEESVATLESSPITVLGAHTSSRIRERVKSLCGEDVARCYQCGECTAGCPAAFAMDIMPNQVIRLVQLGMEDAVLKSSAIWLCAGCETCSTRCPRLVQLSKIMDALRQMAVAERKIGEPNVAKFHNVFIDAIGRHGRVHEVSMLALYKLATKDFLSDMILGMRMFFKGKLKLLPEKIKGVGEIKRIIRKSREESK